MTTPALARGPVPTRLHDAILLGASGGNTGDDLIRTACLRFLRAAGLDIWNSDGTLETAAVAGDLEAVGEALERFPGLVVFSGGGNIGIYAESERLRQAVIGHAAAARAFLVMPQSARAPEPALVDGRVTVWARDRVSERLLARAGVRTALVPDAAFFATDLIPRAHGGEQSLWILRTPGSCLERVDHALTPNGVQHDVTLEEDLEGVVARIAPFRSVVSDRLHGAVVAAMMGKPTALLPVSYHKNRSFYQTWLTEDPGVAFVRSEGDLQRFARLDVSPQTDFRRLFLTRAAPALRDLLRRTTPQE
ncbi:MAG: polysaccharide pyruvyl transferase family protein [Acidimicrobiia bacterium]|nr:MAG: polysaccharide pyruvyl transferase family protein [Acidimicrobiia bacterium]